MNPWFTGTLALLSFFGCDKYLNDGKYTNGQISFSEKVKILNHDYNVIDLLRKIINSFDLNNNLLGHNINYINGIISNNPEILIDNLRCCCFKSNYCSYCLSCTCSCGCSCGDEYNTIKCCCFSFKNQVSNEKSMRELKIETIRSLTDILKFYTESHVTNQNQGKYSEFKKSLEKSCLCR